MSSRLTAFSQNLAEMKVKGAKEPAEHRTLDSRIEPTTAHR